MKIANVALAVALLASPVAAQNGPFTSIGGGDSCGRWIANPSMDSSVKAWIMGFFSGRNSGSDANVGASTDADGIVGEVKLACQNEPSISVSTATWRTYERFRREGR